MNNFEILFAQNKADKNINKYVDEYCEEHFVQETGYVLDDTLTLENAAAQAKAVGDALAGKQNALTFDDTPTNGSNNPVKSGGVYTSVSNRIEKDTYRTYYTPITSGKWVQKNGNDYATGAGLGIGVNVNAGEEYYVTGVSVDASFPLVIFFNSNSSVIGYLHDEGGHAFIKDLKVTIPTNCTYMWVNSEKQYETCVYSISIATTTGNDLKSAIESKGTIPIKWKQSTYVYEYGKFCNAATNKSYITIESSGGYSYARLTYDKTKRYRFCGASRATTILAVVCTDENNIVLKKYETYSNADIVIRLKEYFDIPEETYYIYVNGYNNTNAYIEEAEERDVKSFKTEKVGVFVGDSITQGLNVLKWKTTPYEDFPSVVGNLLGCTVYNGGLGGSTYSSGRKIDFATVVDCIVNGDFDDIYDGIDEYGLNQTAKLQYDMIKELDFTTVDFICIAYGTNDWYFGKTKAQVTEAMVNGIEALMTAYPNLAIYVATPINRFNINDSGEDADTYVNTTSGLKLIDICDAIIDGAKICHVPCKNMFYDCNITAQNKDRYMGDATHPNANGYKMIGEKIAGFINSN